MKYISDNTGRFPYRIFFEDGELDFECDRIVTQFLQEKYGSAKFPISTDDLIFLIEKDFKLDVYAELNEDVEGKTDFTKDSPHISISGALYSDEKRTNRLRTTLTHEYGHAKFHAGIFAMEKTQLNLDIFENDKMLMLISYQKDNLDIKKTDWLEWQANYISGAMLIPISDLKPRIIKFLSQKSLPGTIYVNSHHAQELIQKTSRRYEVSIEAARVSLQQLGYLSEEVFPDLQNSLL